MEAWDTIRARSNLRLEPPINELNLLAIGPDDTSGLHLASLTGTLLAFSTFWAGFVARTIGGVLAGHFGDKYGRKPVGGRDPRQGVSRKRTAWPGQHARCGVCGPVLEYEACSRLIDVAATDIAPSMDGANPAG